jgi:hypothetical protein
LYIAHRNVTGKIILKCRSEAMILMIWTCPGKRSGTLICRKYTRAPWQRIEPFHFEMLCRLNW